MTKKIYTYYDKLSVPRNATDDQIIDAYSELFEKYNPNKLDGDKKQQAERILAAITVAYENLIDPVKRTDHDNWIDKQDKDALSDISKAVGKTFSNVGNEIKNVASSVDLDAIGNQIKHIGESTEKKIGDIGDGLKNFAKNASDKIDLDSAGENAQKKISDINKGLHEFSKKTTDKIDVDKIKKYCKEKLYPFLKKTAYTAITVVLLVMGGDAIKTYFNFNLSSILNTISRDDIVFTKYDVNRLKEEAIKYNREMLEDMVKEMVQRDDQRINIVQYPRIQKYQLGSVTQCIDDLKTKKTTYFDTPILAMKYRTSHSLHSWVSNSAFDPRIRGVDLGISTLTNRWTLAILKTDGSIPFAGFDIGADADNNEKTAEEYTPTKCDFKPLTQKQLDNIQ